MKVKRYYAKYNAPLSQESPQRKGIAKELIDYLKFGKPLSPVIQTEVIIPPETKKFAREIVFTVVGAGLAAVLLYRAFR